MKKYSSSGDSDHNPLGSEPEDSRDIDHNLNKANEENFTDHNVKRASSSHPVGQQDMSDSSLGLPFGWNGRNIPSGKQLFEAATRSYKRMQNRLLDEQIIPSELQLKSDSETIIRTSEFATLLPEVVDFTLKLKDRFFGAACLNLWNTLLIKLFHKATNYDVDKDTQSRMLSQIAIELGVISSVQSNHEAAVARLKQAIDFALKNTHDESWLRAQIEHFHATCLQTPLEDVQPRANELLDKAKFHQDYFAQMRVYMTLADVNNQYADFKRGFVYGQQALSIAMMLQNRSYILFALTLLTPYVFETPHLKAYRHDIITYYYKELKNTNNLRLQATYLSQISPYLYRQKQYSQAQMHYRKSIDLYKRMMDKSNLARMYHGLGMTCTQLEEWNEAQTNFDHALKCYNELKRLSDCVWIQHCIGWLNLKRGNIDEGIQLLQIAYEAAKNLPLDIKRREILIKNIRKDLDDARSPLKGCV